MPPNKEIGNYVCPASLPLLILPLLYCPLCWYLSAPGLSCIRTIGLTLSLLGILSSRYLHGLQSYLLQVFIQMSPL